MVKQAVQKLIDSESTRVSFETYVASRTHSKLSLCFNGLSYIFLQKCTCHGARTGVNCHGTGTGVNATGDDEDLRYGAGWGKYSTRAGV